MPAKRTRQTKTEKTSPDSINDLPSNITDSILQKLPIRDAIRTSVLSKQWRYRWSLMPELDFGAEFYKGIRQAALRKGRSSAHSLMYQFERIVNRIFLLHETPIAKVSIYLPDFGNIYLPDFESDEIPDVNQWILYAKSKGIKKLALDNRRTDPRKLPSYFFSCQDFTYLKLRNFVFAPPPGFHGFRNITHLEFVKVKFTIDIFETFIPSGLPLLKELTLVCCSGLDHFKVNAPNLENLRVEANFEFKSMCFECVPNLTHVSVEVSQYTRTFHCHAKYTLASYLDSLPKVEKHFYNGKFLQFLAAIHFRNPMILPTMVDSLKILHLSEINFTNFDEMSCVLYLLRNFPNIEELDIQASTIEGDESVAGYLEPQDSEEYHLARLRLVKIEYVEGLKSELLFIKLLLSNAISLEEMIITPDPHLSIESQLSVAEELISFHRASPLANVKYMPHY